MMHASKLPLAGLCVKGAKDIKDLLYLWESEI